MTNCITRSKLYTYIVLQTVFHNISAGSGDYFKWTMFYILLTILVATLVYLKIIKPYDFWVNRGVKQRKQVYLLGDNGSVIFQKETSMDLMKKLYDAFPTERYMGMYQLLLPMLVIRDPDLIKLITVKDFDHFVDHRQFIPEGADPLWSRNLFALKGNRWRDMRSTLSPSFTTSKMKGIFSLVTECAEDMVKYFTEMGEGTKTLELKDTFTRYTNDVIATVAFGLKCDSLRDRQNEFYLMGKEATSFVGFWRNMKFFAYTLAPALCKSLGMTFFPKKASKFFVNIISDTIKVREEKGIVRPDMIHLLMEARKGRSKPDESSNGLVDTGFATVEESNLHNENKIIRKEITDIDIAAQALIFFFGGFESVSTLMCFMGHELAANPDVQRKLQKEVDDTSKGCGGKLTYEALMKMKYMDMVVSEILRKWPVSIGTDRVCVKPYTIEPTRPDEKPIHLEKGEIIFIPISGIHYDPQYFPDPEKFDPERFNDENKDNIKPFTYLPFGMGPRSCIASRFALLETKTIFFNLLSKFDIVAVEKTQIPLKLSKKSLDLFAEKGFWIGLKSRT